MIYKSQKSKDEYKQILEYRLEENLDKKDLQTKIDLDRFPKDRKSLFPSSEHHQN